MSSLLAYSLGMEREGALLAAGIGFSFQAEEEALPTDRFLHPSEERFLSNLRYPLRQANYLLGRRAAKAALGICFPEVQPVDIEVGHGIFGQPILRGAVAAGEVSLAHSRGAAVAVACALGHPIGVDLEWIDPERASTVEGSLRSEERARWEQADLATLEASFVAWTAHEALSKVLRCGLTVPFDLLEIGGVTRESGSFRAVFLNFPQYAARSWLVGGYALSIVFPKRSSLGFVPTEEIRLGLAATAQRSAESPAIPRSD